MSLVDRMNKRLAPRWYDSYAALAGRNVSTLHRSTSLQGSKPNLMFGLLMDLLDTETGRALNAWKVIELSTKLPLSRAEGFPFDGLYEFGSAVFGKENFAGQFAKRVGLTEARLKIALGKEGRYLPHHKALIAVACFLGESELAAALGLPAVVKKAA